MLVPKPGIGEEALVDTICEPTDWESVYAPGPGLVPARFTCSYLKRSLLAKTHAGWFIVFDSSCLPTAPSSL